MLIVSVAHQNATRTTNASTCAAALSKEIKNQNKSERIRAAKKMKTERVHFVDVFFLVFVFRFFVVRNSQWNAIQLSTWASSFTLTNIGAVSVVDNLFSLVSRFICDETHARVSLANTLLFILHLSMSASVANRCHPRWMHRDNWNENEFMKQFNDSNWTKEKWFYATLEWMRISMSWFDGLHLLLIVLLDDRVIVNNSIFLHISFCFFTQNNRFSRFYEMAAARSFDAFHQFICCSFIWPRIESELFALFFRGNHISPLSATQDVAQSRHQRRVTFDPSNADESVRTWTNEMCCQ